MSCLYIATSKFGPVIGVIRSQRTGNAREIVQRFALSASMVVVAAPVMLVPSPAASTEVAAIDEAHLEDQIADTDLADADMDGRLSRGTTNVSAPLTHSHKFPLQLLMPVRACRLATAPASAAAN